MALHAACIVSYFPKHRQLEIQARCCGAQYIAAVAVAIDAANSLVISKGS